MLSGWYRQIRNQEQALAALQARGKLLKEEVDADDIDVDGWSA